MLAGVSVDYYVRMERGSLAGASESVLDALASALQLDEAERDHLFALARESGPTVAAASGSHRHRAAGTAAAARRHHRRAGLDPQRPARRPRDEPAGPRPLRPRARRPAPSGEHHPVRLPAPRGSRAFFVDYDQIASDAAAMLRLEAGASARRGAHRAGRRAVHPQRAVPATLGLTGRAIPPLRPQAAAPSRRRPARPRLRGDGAAFRAGPALNIYTAAAGTPAADGLKLLASWAASQENLLSEHLSSNG